MHAISPPQSPLPAPFQPTTTRAPEDLRAQRRRRDGSRVPYLPFPPFVSLNSSHAHTLTDARRLRIRIGQQPTLRLRITRVDPPGEYFPYPYPRQHICQRRNQCPSRVRVPPLFKHKRQMRATQRWLEVEKSARRWRQGTHPVLVLPLPPFPFFLFFSLLFSLSSSLARTPPNPA
ncbi:hypothetical protein DFH06DRAFT_1176493 [Mycena polygramma]|nr:hypothetical protein DFH06DRAFT_1176447 [Mycena polygramma]KAJ7672502.1 hypothetical protein DFH06DRAFT_1176468 [Mycena polygramma]KAJ7672506.1 hypothetical protein DFH06DRAFT_1176493 [Mycena polygramma]